MSRSELTYIGWYWLTAFVGGFALLFVTYIGFGEAAFRQLLGSCIFGGCLLLRAFWESKVEVDAGIFIGACPTLAMLGQGLATSVIN